MQTRNIWLIIHIYVRLSSDIHSGSLRASLDKCSSHDSEERIFSRVAKVPLAVTYLIRLNMMDITCLGSDI